MYKDQQSKYCYPGTDILINKANLRDQRKLDEFDKLVTTKRLAELVERPIKGAFDMNHLSRIHRYIFQDVYPFAGEIRSEEIAKDSFRFANAHFIPLASRDLFQQLKRENHLIGMDVEKTADRLSHYMAEINVLHPFREGNGRAQREFIRSLANNAGYELNWSKVEPARILEASIKSVTDTRDLASVILQSIVNREPNRELLRGLERPGKGKERGMER
ncbi:Fic/DOC family protein [Brevibacillus agri]|uniref:Fic/DOC family protein n=1 Tax=Brevibacillus agri TaxID=51101 RepID=UPI0018CD7DE9|nr:Fic family protein [Brevibacillus agri]MBG9568427.1 Fic family protein [Brevibacillus agri]MBG9568489.1 Fic family protein [Brevibacillus agri]